MKKVAIYARVSTALQEQEKTIQSQLAELREICKGFEVFKEYIDDGWSGETLDRPALDQLRNDAKEGLFETLYVHSVDRLSRNLYQQGILVEGLKKCGVEIYIGDKSIADTPEGRFMFNVLGAAAEYEKEKILERTRRGRIYKAKQKGIVGYIPPYGYDYIKRTSEVEEHFSINNKEAEIVNLIFDLYLNFQSITRVQKELSLKGIPSRKGCVKWSRSTIGDILRDETNIGVGYYGKYRSVEIENGKKYRRRVKTGRQLRDKSEWIRVNFPNIVDENKFRFAQEILSKKYKPFGKCKYFYLLSGLIKCANCGSTFTGAGNGVHPYYRCSNRRKQLPFPQDCRVRHMRKEDLDDAVWTTVSEAIINRKILIAHISHLANKITQSKDTLEKEKERLLIEKNGLIQKKNRLLEIYTDGDISKEQFLEKTESYNQKGEEVNKKIEELDSKLKQIISRPVIIKDLQYFCDLAKQKIRLFNPEQRQQFLKLVLEEIDLDSNKRRAKIVGYVPVEAQDFEQFFAQIHFSSEQNSALSMSWKV